MSLCDAHTFKLITSRSVFILCAAVAVWFASSLSLFLAPSITGTIFVSKQSSQSNHSASGQPASTSFDTGDRARLQADLHVLNTSTSFGIGEHARPEEGQHVVDTSLISLLVLMRTGKSVSRSRIASINETWGRDLENGSLDLFQPDDECKAKYGDNHWKGLTCLEAANLLRIMNRTDYEWALVVDDDVYVFADRLRDTLRTMDPSKPEVYGAPYCGDCGGGRKGFCGGSGYIISRLNLLRMADALNAPMTSDLSRGSNLSRAFVEHFMSPPMSVWCDVRFACVAQDKGLRLVGVRGMKGNGIKQNEEDREISFNFTVDPPMVYHNVRNTSDMRRIYWKSNLEKERHRGKSTAYNVKGLKPLRKWILPEFEKPVTLSPNQQAAMAAAAVATWNLPQFEKRATPAPEQQASTPRSAKAEHIFLLVLMRTGKKNVSSQRVGSIRETWGRDLEEGALTLFQEESECKARFGDNHWKGLTCLEAKAHLRLMNRTDFDWVLVVDDDNFVFVDRLRETLHTMDTLLPAVYGVPLCGNCTLRVGKKRRGMCGGSGYMLSRPSLLRMANLSHGPVPLNTSRRFLEHFMSPPMAVWCDVRFGCVAQDTGLKVLGVRGLYGNGVYFNGKKNTTEEMRVVRLESQEAPLVIHNVKDLKHMHRLYEAYVEEKMRHRGQATAYNVRGSKAKKKWLW